MPLSKDTLDLIDELRSGGSRVRQVGEERKPIQSVAMMPPDERTRRVAETMSTMPGYNSDTAIGKYVTQPFNAGLVDFGGVLARGANAVGSDVYGAPEDRWRLSAASQAQDISAERTDSTNPIVSMVQRGARGAVRSTASTLIPGLAAGPYGAIVAGGAVAGEQAYQEAIEKGYDKPLVHAINQGGAEILIAGVFQKLGLGGVENMYGKAGKGFLTQGIKATASAVAKQIGRDTLAELGEEELTTIYQTLTSPNVLLGLKEGQSVWTHEDGSIGWKADPETGRLTLPPMQQAIADTAAQTILQTGATSGVRGAKALVTRPKDPRPAAPKIFPELPMRPTEQIPQPKQASDFPVGSSPRVAGAEADTPLPPGSVVVAHDNGKVIVETPGEGKKPYDPEELEPQFTPYKHLQSFAAKWYEDNPEAATKLLQGAAKNGGTPSIKDFENAGLDRHRVTAEQRKEFAGWLSKMPPPRPPVTDEQILQWLDEAAPAKAQKPPVKMLGPKPRDIKQVNAGDLVTIGDDDYAKVVGTAGRFVLVEGTFGQASVDLKRITSHRPISKIEQPAAPMPSGTPPEPTNPKRLGTPPVPPTYPNNKQIGQPVAAPAAELSPTSTPAVQQPTAPEIAPAAAPTPEALPAAPIEPAPEIAPTTPAAPTPEVVQPPTDVPPQQIGKPKKPKLEHPGLVRTGDRGTPAAPAAPAPSPDDNSPDVVLAKDIADTLRNGYGIDRDTFWRKADAAHGGTRAEGKYGPSDAYDSLELGVNLSLQGQTNPTVDAPRATAQARMLEELVAKLPSQTNRSGEKITMQQFSTPPSYAFTVAWLANIQPTDIVLEPSAGTGSIVVQAQNAKPAAVYGNEWSDRRARLVKQLGLAGVFSDDAEQASNILPALMPKPNVVLMNPPFSHAGKRLGDKKVIGTDLKHIDEQLKFMAPGGRLVAIIGAPLHGEAGDTQTFTKWFNQQSKVHNIRANVMVGRDVYKGYGTTFPTRVLVIDKNGPTQSTIKGDAETLPELIDLLEEVRNDRLLGTEQKPAQSGSAQGAPDAGSGGQSGREPTVQPGTSAVGDAQRPTASERGDSGESVGSPGSTIATRPDRDSGDADAASGRSGRSERPEASGTGGEVVGGVRDGAGEGRSPGDRGAGEPTGNNAASNPADAGLDVTTMTPEQMAEFLKKQGRPKPVGPRKFDKLPEGTPPQPSPGATPKSDSAPKSEPAAPSMTPKLDEAKKKLADLLAKKKKPQAGSGDVQAMASEFDDDIWSAVVDVTTQAVAEAKLYDFKDYVNFIKDSFGKETTAELAPYIEQAWDALKGADPSGKLGPTGDVDGILNGPRREPKKPETKAPKTETKSPKAETKAPDPNIRNTDYNNVAESEAENKAAEKRDSLGDSVFEAYKPSKLKLAGSQPHRGSLVESVAMGAVEAPDISYKIAIPKDMIEKGLLSEAQLEQTFYAGQAHSQMLKPDAKGVEYRRGYMIGDGTGVGKGREIASIILDNFNKGRKRAVWVSKNTGLYKDAVRDWGRDGLKQDESKVYNHSKKAIAKSGGSIEAGDGILFSTYGTLKTEASTKAKAKGNVKSRVDQIVEWVGGEDFDGVIAFDEAHMMGAAVDAPGSRGKNNISMQSEAGQELQDRLPNARIVYVSATSATEVHNLGYAPRLGLWGKGTAFQNVSDFVAKIVAGGVATMELVARDMKAMGLYLARSLSYNDGTPKGTVTFGRLEHKLLPEQRAQYDRVADGWQVVLKNFEAALKLTGANKKARTAATSAFWSSELRFFSQYTTNLQLPSVLDDIERQLAEKDENGQPKNSVVIQLTNTDEALQERELAKREKGDEDYDEFSINPLDELVQMVDRSFPTQQYEDVIDPNNPGKTIRRPVVRNTGKKDSDGKPIFEPVHNAEAMAMKAKLLEDIKSIASTIPGSPIDQIIDRFGHEMVAEVTGRKRRVINMENAKGELARTENKRTKDFSNAAETAAFQGGKKRILIFSEAGGTGSSYHASNEAANQQKRIHYLLQAGWKAATAVQGFGRTHRTNQAQAPHYVLVSTDLAGQKRFISTIARRLAQLGALTKGQRQTGFGAGKDVAGKESGMFTSADNLEGSDAADSLRIFFQLMRQGKTSISLQEFQEKTSLKLVDDKTGQLAATLPKISQVLNRILVLDFETQNKVFEEFFALHSDRIANLKATGRLDDGVENVKALKVEKASDTVVRTDPDTGAKTRYVKLVVHEKTEPISWTTIVAQQVHHQKNQFVEFKGKVYAVFDSQSPRPDPKTGVAIPRNRMVSPDGGRPKYEDVDIVNQMTKLDEETAKRMWDAQVLNAPKTQSYEMHMIVGLILPIWDKLTGDTQVRRALTDKGESLLGRIIPTQQVPAVLKNLGISDTGAITRPKLTPAEAVARVFDDGDTLVLDRGHLDWRIKRVRVQNEMRIELVGPTFTNEPSLLQDGVFKETIQSKPRWFIPVGKDSEAVMKRILEQYPIKAIRKAKDSDSQPLRIGRTNDDVQAMTSATAAPPKRLGTPAAPKPGVQTMRNMRSSPGAPVIPAGMETTPGVIYSHHQIIQTMSRWFGVPVRTGRLGMKSALGIYKKLARIVRFDRQADADLAVASHEFAHHIDNVTKLTRTKAYGREIGKELKGLDYDVVRGNTPLQAGRQHEGFAEFLRHYLTTDQSEIQSKTPKFLAYFENTFLPAHPEIAKRIEASKSLIDRWRQQGAANRVEASISKTGVQPGPMMPWTERVPEWLRNTFNDVYVRWKDKGHTIKRFDAAARQHGWKMPAAGTTSYALLSAYDQAGPSAAARAIDDGVFSVTDGRKLSKGLREYLAKIDKTEYEEFRRFLWARHAQEVHLKGRSLPDGGRAPMNPGMSLQDANWIVGEVWADMEKGKRFLEAAEGVTKFNQALLDMLVDSGVITEQSADRMKAYWETYIPLMRARDEKSGIGLGKKYVDLPPAIRGRRGSGRQILDPIESTIQQAAQFFDRAYKQQVMLQLVAEGDPQLGGAQGMGEWIDRVPPKTEVTRVNLGEVWPAITKKLLELGIEEDLNVDRRMLEQLGDEFIDDWVNIYRTDHSPDPRHNIIRIVKNDRPILYQVNKELYQSLEGMDRIQVPSFLKIFTMVNKMRRLGATGLNTMFAGANVVRDWVTFQFQTRNSNGLESIYSPFYWMAAYIRSAADTFASGGEESSSFGKLLQGVARTIGKKDEISDLWKEMGGQLSTKLGLDRPGLEKTRKEIVAHSTPQKLRELLVHPLDTFRDVISISDVGPRLAEFAGVLRKHGYVRNKKGQIVNKQTNKPERPPRAVLVEAINAANDVTVNFKRMGSQGRWVNEFYLFFNASLESIDKTGRTLAAAARGEENVRSRVIVAMAAMASASLLYWLSRSDDDDYEEEEQWLKQGYWTLADETGKPLWRVPKPYEWGFIPNMVEGILNSMKKESVQPFKDTVIGQLEKMTPGGNGLTGVLNGVSLVGTSIETAFNYDTFRGQEIENRELKKLEEGDRATPYNSELVKAIGGYLDISPAKSEHFLNGITGGGWNRVVGGTERVLGGKGTDADIPAFGAFIVKKDYAKSITAFYERTDELEKQYNSAKKKGMPDPALASEFHNYEDFESLMSEMRAPIKGEFDRDKRFEIEKYLVGLSREILGEKPLDRYPSPFDVPLDKLPPVVKSAVLKYRKRLIERVKEKSPKHTLGETQEHYAKRVNDWRILKSRSSQLLQRLRPTLGVP